LTHEALAAWRFPAREPADAFLLWLETRAREYGLTDERQIRHAATRSLQLLQRFQDHPQFQEMDTARRLHELPYAVQLEDRLELGQVDLLYERDGRWHMVDFKTDRVSEWNTLSQILVEKGYEEQVKRYGRALARLLGKKPHCSICLLDFKQAVHLHKVVI
jgi:ATP-dependent exoDNAse (exonuclease V) beta subunit